MLENGTRYRGDTVYPSPQPELDGLNWSALLYCVGSSYYFLQLSKLQAWRHGEDRGLIVHAPVWGWWHHLILHHDNTVFFFALGHVEDRFSKSAFNTQSWSTLFLCIFPTILWYYSEGPMNPVFSTFKSVVSMTASNFFSSNGTRQKTIKSTYP